MKPTALSRLAPLLLVCGSLLSSVGGAQRLPSADNLAVQRAAHLQRGINTSMWFAQAPGNYSVERLRRFTTPDDLKLIHRLGFDHIRLSVDATPLLGWMRGTPDGQQFVAELDRVVGEANDDGLSVIIDLHPETAYKQTLLQGTESTQSFAALWRAVAKHFSGRDPEQVFFEIMNEPEQNDPYRWEGIESLVAGQIREVAPHFTLIASGAHWDSIPDLLALEPLPYDNVIYTFHDYDPFAFTHQGATWANPEVQPLRAVPYPSTPENVAPNLAQEPTLAAQFFVEQYGLDRWDAQRVEATISFAKRWSELHHVPIYCGEFGVHKPVVQEADRDRWLHDMRVALERYGIGWAMWDYQTNFGAVIKQDGVAKPDEGVIHALGLKPAK